jgi:hypothetical protein
MIREITVGADSTMVVRSKVGENNYKPVLSGGVSVAFIEEEGDKKPEETEETDDLNFLNKSEV